VLLALVGSRGIGHWLSGNGSMPNGVNIIAGRNHGDMTEHPPPKRPRGRPPLPHAKSRADIQRDYRERRKAAGKVLRVIDTRATMTPAESAKLREKLDRALRELTLRKQDVARLMARNTQIEVELRRVEQHNLRLLKDIIALKQAAAEPPVRTRRRAE